MPAAARPASAAGTGGPGRRADGWLLAAGQKKELQELYQLGPQLGSGGFGTVFSGTRLSDGSPVSGRHGRARPQGQGRGRAGLELSPPCVHGLQVAIKRVARESVLQWVEWVSERGQRAGAGRGGQG